MAPELLLWSRPCWRGGLGACLCLVSLPEPESDKLTLGRKGMVKSKAFKLGSDAASHKASPIALPYNRKRFFSVGSLFKSASGHAVLLLGVEQSPGIWYSSRKDGYSQCAFKIATFFFCCSFLHWESGASGTYRNKRCQQVYLNANTPKLEAVLLYSITLSSFAYAVPDRLVIQRQQ